MVTVRVMIATTGGPVTVDRIIEERVPQSIVCLKRTSHVLPISHDYNDFVCRGSGVINREFGGESFRLDLSSEIESGTSWQLGVYVAHTIANHTNMQLARDDQAADIRLLVSGQVDYELTVGTVGHIEEKLRAAKSKLSSLGGDVHLLVSKAQDMTTVNELIPEFIKVHSLASANDVLTILKVADRGSHGVEVMPIDKSNAGAYWGSLVGALAIIGLFMVLTFDYGSSRLNKFVSIKGVFAPDGVDCASVHFGELNPIIKPLSTVDRNPCGVEIIIKPMDPPQYIDLHVRALTGRLVLSDVMSRQLEGDILLTEPVTYRISVPLVPIDPLNIEFIVMADDNPIDEIYGNIDELIARHDKEIGIYRHTVKLF